MVKSSINCASLGSLHFYDKGSYFDNFIKYSLILFNDVCPPLIKYVRFSSEGGLYSIIIRSKCSDSVVRVSWSPLESIALKYGIPYMIRKWKRYIAVTIIRYDRVDQ